MKKGKEGSDNLSKQSLNGMLGPGDVDYDEEGFVIEREEADVLETADMDEARKKWRQLCDVGKAKYFGFENGIYRVEGRSN